VSEPEAAYSEMALAPSKAASKVRGTTQERLLPEPVTEEPAELRVHWLFCTEPVPFKAKGPSHAFCASFIR
jgi:hypothetical protein